MIAPRQAIEGGAMFAGLGDVVGHKDDKSQSARLAADLFLIGGASRSTPTVHEMVSANTSSRATRRTTGSRIHPGAARCAAGDGTWRSVTAAAREVRTGPSWPSGAGW